MLTYAIAILPALLWGSYGMISTKIGGTAGQQTLGVTFGALAFGLATLLIFVLPHGVIVSSHIIIAGALSGLLWAVGQAGQFRGFKALGLTNAFPISTAGQIIGNAALAATILGEWSTARMWIFGILAIVLVVLGAVLTSKRDTAIKNGDEAAKGETTQGLIALLVSTVGYSGYYIVPNYMRKIGYISHEISEKNNGVDFMTATVFPQAAGMVVGAMLIVAFFMHESKTMFQAPTWKNMVSGVVWAIGNLAMFISAANPKIGQATAVTISQMGIIVATFGGIYLLHEHKSKQQMIYVIAGSILIILGGVLISNLPK